MYNSLIVPDLRLMLREGDAIGLRQFGEYLHPAVVAEVLGSMEPEEVWQVLSFSDLNLQVEIFQFFTIPQQLELVEIVDRTRLSRLLEEMAADDRDDLLGRLDPDIVERLLPLIAQAERNDIRKLLSYEENSAGSIMTTEYSSLSEDMTVTEGLAQLRQQAPDRETIYYIYIVDESRRLLGLVSLRELILANPDRKLSEIMRRDIIFVNVHDDKEEVAQQLARYDFLAIPVVDWGSHLVGIVTHDDILDVLQDEATEDAHRLGAVEPLEDSYLQTPMITIAWKRGVWLLFLSVVALITAKVLEGYKDVSARYEWMLLFLPLVLASGGNTGSQSATLVIRTIALGELPPKERVVMARRELLLGLFLGLALAMLGFFSAMFWFELGTSQSAAIGLTVLLVVMMGSVTGALLPVMFKSLGMDPALMSNPLIAALVDVLGVVIYYTVTAIMLGS